MYLEVFQYNPSHLQEHQSVEAEIRDFINYYPMFKVVKIESLVTGKYVTIHVWYKEK